MAPFLAVFIQEEDSKGITRHFCGSALYGVVESVRQSHTCRRHDPHFLGPPCPVQAAFFLGYRPDLDPKSGRPDLMSWNTKGIGLLYLLEFREHLEAWLAEVSAHKGDMFIPHAVVVTQSTIISEIKHFEQRDGSLKWSI